MLSNAQVVISGTCQTPYDLHGKALEDLKESDIKCPLPPTPKPDDGGGNSSSAKNVAIVFGVILLLVLIASVGYFVYDRFLKHTYLSL